MIIYRNDVKKLSYKEIDFCIFFRLIRTNVKNLVDQLLSLNCLRSGKWLLTGLAYLVESSSNRPNIPKLIHFRNLLYFAETNFPESVKKDTIIVET